jgi:hypothetical protein
MYLGLVRINDDLHKKIAKVIKQEKYKYRFPSISSFINNVVFEKLDEIEDPKREKL